MFHRLLSCALGLIIMVCASQAQTSRSAAEVPVLPQIEVNADKERSPTPSVLTELENRTRRIPGGAETIGNEAFRDGRASSFKDFFQHATGVYFASDNAGEITKISIRGSGIQSDETLGVQILLDGLPYNQGDGEANLEELDLSAIAGAEIHRGAAALRYGSYVLGGAINLTPRTGRNSPGVHVRAEAGSFGYQHATLGAGYASDRADIYLGAAGRRTDGFRAHSAEDARTFTGNFGFHLTPTIENRFYFGFSEWTRQIFGDVTRQDVFDHPKSADDEALEGDFHLFTRSLRVADRIVFTTANSRTEAGALYHRRRFSIYDLYERDFRLGVTEATSDNFGLLLSHSRQTTLAGRPNEWIIGLAPAHEMENSTNYRNDDGVIDRTRKTASSLTRGINFPVYFENNFVATDQLSLLAGAQFVWIDRDFEDRFWTDSDGDQSHRQTFRGYNPKFGVVYQRTPDDAVFLNVSRSFQPPSFDDLNPFESGTNGSVVYVPLEAQRAWTFEIGARGERGRFEWDLALYHSWVRNELLELNDTSGRDIGTTNVPRARHQGIELGVDIELIGSKTNARQDRLTLRQEYTLNDFHFDGDPVYGDNRIAGIPIHLYQLELAWRDPAGFYFAPSLECNFSRYPADQANTLHAGAFAVIGLKTGFKGKRFSVFFDAQNLGDRRYAAMVKPIADARTADDDDLAIFAPGQGRAFFAGVSFDW